MIGELTVKQERENESLPLPVRPMGFLNDQMVMVTSSHSVLPSHSVEVIVDLFLDNTVV